MPPKKTSASPPSPATWPGLSAQDRKLLDDLDFPGKKLKPEAWWKTVAVYPEGGLCHCYIYRRWPHIDRKLIDPKAPLYIAKHEGPLTAEQLLRTWGSGEYRLNWVDDSKARGKTRICETVLNLHDPERPPVVDLRELVIGNPANLSYVRGLQARGELPTDDKPVAGDPGSVFAALAANIVTKAVENAQDDSSGDIQEKILDLYKTASEKAIEIASGAGAPDPVKMVKNLMQIVKPDTGMLTLLIDSQDKHQTQMFNLMKSQQKDQTGGGGIGSSLDELEKVVTVVDKLAKRGGGGVTSWVSDIPDILTGVAGIMTAFAAIRAGFSAPAPAAARKPPGSATESAAAVPPALPAKPAETAGTEAGPLTEAELTEIGKRALAALNEGFEGDDFAVSLSLWRGESVYRQIVALGEDTLNMILMPVVQPEDQPAVKKFVGEFFSYSHETEEQPGDADIPRPAEASAPGAEAA